MGALSVRNAGMVARARRTAGDASRRDRLATCDGGGALLDRTLQVQAAMAESEGTREAAGRLDPEDVDLAVLARDVALLDESLLAGDIMGRTNVRDEVVRLLGCSELEAEELVDTMVARGFLVRRQGVDGWVQWGVGEGEPP